MINDEIMIGNGFKKMRGRNFAKKTGDIIILAQDMGEKAVFTVWGESPTVDFGDEIAQYVAEITSATDYISSDFAKSKLTLVCDISDGNNIPEKIKTSVEIIKKANDKFDFVSTCSECGRRGPVEILCSESGAKTICGVCSSDNALHDKHERIKQKYDQRKTGSYVLGIIEKRKFAKCAKSGILLGVLAGLLTWGILICGLYVPQFFLLMWLPTGLSGYYIMRKVNKMDHMPLFIRFLIGTVVYMAILFTICFLGLIIMLSINKISLGGYNFGLFETIMIVVSIIGFIIGGVISFATDDNI